MTNLSYVPLKYSSYISEETVLTNGTLGCSWMKATEGLKKFSSIVRSEGTSRELLIEELMKLLQDDTE